MVETTINTSDEVLLNRVQRETFRFFWDFAHPVSGLAFDRISDTGAVGPFGPHAVSIGGSGFGVLALVVGVERGWVTREAGARRVFTTCNFLLGAERYHGIFPHLLHGESGRTIPFGPQDDGADLVETAYLFAGLLCAREYFDSDEPDERALRARIGRLWHEAQWDWHVGAGDAGLYWHWSPNHAWDMAFPIRGWNECLITYVLAASSPTHAIDPGVYHAGWATGPDFTNGGDYHGIRLPLGPDYGGPLFFAHYSFLALDPRGLTDRYANYWEQNVNHTLINREHCVRNPNGHASYGAQCWGLTASDNPDGYSAHSPTNDHGVVTPTAALSSMPYTPGYSMQVLRHFHEVHGERLWGKCGFVDAFHPGSDWYATSYLAIDQGPIVAMTENHRSALLWGLFMKVPDIQCGLSALGFHSPHLPYGGDVDLRQGARGSQRPS